MPNFYIKAFGTNENNILLFISKIFFFQKKSLSNIWLIFKIETVLECYVNQSI